MLKKISQNFVKSPLKFCLILQLMACNAGWTEGGRQRGVGKQRGGGRLGSMKTQYLCYCVTVFLFLSKSMLWVLIFFIGAHVRHF